MRYGSHVSTQRLPTCTHKHVKSLQSKNDTLVPLSISTTTECTWTLVDSVSVGTLPLLVFLDSRGGVCTVYDILTVHTGVIVQGRVRARRWGTRSR